MIPDYPILSDVLMLACLYLSFGAAMMFFSGWWVPVAAADERYVRKHGRLAPAWRTGLVVVLALLAWPRMIWES